MAAHDEIAVDMSDGRQSHARTQGQSVTHSELDQAEARSVDRVQTTPHSLHVDAEGGTILAEAEVCEAGQTADHPNHPESESDRELPALMLAAAAEMENEDVHECTFPSSLGFSRGAILDAYEASNVEQNLNGLILICVMATGFAVQRILRIYIIGNSTGLVGSMTQTWIMCAGALLTLLFTVYAMYLHNSHQLCAHRHYVKYALISVAIYATAYPIVEAAGPWRKGMDQAAWTVVCLNSCSFSLFFLVAGVPLWLNLSHSVVRGAWIASAQMFDSAALSGMIYLPLLLTTLVLVERRARHSFLVTLRHISIERKAMKSERLQRKAETDLQKSEAMRVRRELEANLRKAEAEKATQLEAYVRIGSTVVNHEAKRAISNTTTWMEHIDDVLIPKLSDAAAESNCSTAIDHIVIQLREITENVRVDTQDAFQGCRNVIMQQKIAAGTYSLRNDAFRVVDYCTAHFGCRKRVKVTFGSGVPDAILMDVDVFSNLFRNMIHNAEMHGDQTGDVRMHISAEDEGLQITVSNAPGQSHARSRELQTLHGKNFLLVKNDELIDEIRNQGSKDSTFLGMREIATTAQLLGAQVSLEFEVAEVITSVRWVSVKPCDQEPKPEGTEGAPDGQSNVAVKLLEETTAPQEPITYILCDDDKAPRQMAVGLFRKLSASQESLILGASHAEILDVPATVLRAVSRVGEWNVMCIFDQNMHWDEGTILGSDLTMQLRESGFKGLICMRTANDSDISVREYMRVGASAVFSKGISAKELVPKLQELLNTRPIIRPSAIGGDH